MRLDRSHAAIDNPYGSVVDSFALRFRIGNFALQFRITVLVMAGSHVQWFSTQGVLIP
jgi:hypothetical protein